MKTMWLSAYEVVKTLREAGYEVVYAGGCVRDLIMCRTPKDIDIVTNARPEQVEALYPKTLALGKAFGVITVIQGKYSFEVATFRKDGNYSDGRHPEMVNFCEMREDALRRDFTINGMFYRPSAEKVPNNYKNLIDYVGGKQDLENKVVRFIGDPKERICEDKLRMLRAIRFASCFDFDIDPLSMEAVQNNASSISAISIERIREELFQIICCSNPANALELLDKSGLLTYVLPEVVKLRGVEQGVLYHPEGNVFIHTKAVMCQVAPTPTMRMAALLHDIAKPQTFKIRKGKLTFYGHDKKGQKVAQEILKHLKCSNDFIKEVSWLVGNHMRFFQVKNMKNSTLIKLLRQPHFEKLLALHKADALGSNDDLSLWSYATEKYKELQSTFWPQPFLNGDKLIKLGYQPGPIYQSILKDVENQQLNGTLRSPQDAVLYILDVYPKTEYTHNN